MHRRLIILMALFSLIGNAATAADPKRPNVLFLISDDLNNLLGCYGDPMARTPNLDRLALRGVRFDRAYCSFPLCGPSRNSFLTGLYPNSTGIQANEQIFRQTIPSQVSMPQAFRQAGYFAARIGKLYHYNVPRSIGTNGHDDPGSWEMELNPAGVDRLEEEPNIFTLQRGNFGGTLSWYASPKADEYHTDGLMAEDAGWVLERCARKKDRPFFLAVGYFRPHTPYVSPKSYFDLYPEAQMPVVQGIKEDQADIPSPGLASAKKDQDQMSDDLRRQCRQAYYASISFMDAQVGKVVDTLDRLGLSENTIIVFTSDHGYHMGEHGLWQKMSLFEESARVPLLIMAPGVSQSGGVAGSPVSQVDLFPTLAELCGVPAPSNLQGQSLVPMLKDPSVVGRGWAITQVTRGAAARNSGTKGGRFLGYSLRTPRWRYTEWDEGKEGRELYDHDADPREITNLATDPSHAKTVEALSAQLQAAAKSTFPPSGKIPPLLPRVWAPNLTNP
ncbi:sulfatase [Tundrisphaera lichenicola]|uniref:sulfatase n=1 Tax=Tundrisphaera lichenicola TaxID=2029860 RepID=UPI003EBF2C3A